MITDLCVTPRGTPSDILSNQHLLPLTTELYWQMTRHVVAHCVMMCGLDRRREKKGASRDTREKSPLWETGGQLQEEELTH